MVLRATLALSNVSSLLISSFPNISKSLLKLIEAIRTVASGILIKRFSLYGVDSSLETLLFNSFENLHPTKWIL